MFYDQVRLFGVTARTDIIALSGAAASLRQLRETTEKRPHRHSRYEITAL